jgi:LAS superfamily LD-carboxypeptidase LdcB
MIKAIKRELSVSDDERGGPPPPGKKEQGEINENPSTVASPADPTPNPGPTSSNPTETEPPLDTKHKLDLIPGSYVDNSGNKIQLCQIEGKPVNVKIADAYLNMKEDATKAGVKFKCSSGFRSPYDPINTTSASGVKVSASSQQQLYQAYLDGKGNLAAKPGASNHGNGIGMDLSTGSRKSKSSGPLDSKVYDWLIKNSWRYGFVRAVATEEWHFDYLPSISKNGPYAKLNSSKRDANRFYTDLGLDKLDDITKTA